MTSSLLPCGCTPTDHQRYRTSGGSPLPECVVRELMLESGVTGVVPPTITTITLTNPVHMGKAVVKATFPRDGIVDLEVHCRRTPVVGDALRELVAGGAFEVYLVRIEPDTSGFKERKDG